MPTFLKAGKTRVNLDLVQAVDERTIPDPTGKPGSVPGVVVRFSAVGGDTLSLTGDDARTFLAAVDKTVPATAAAPAAPTK